ncbi:MULTISPECIES: Na+/H+ antiporter NhaA [unclassified Arthrobacter]|uniref:Na+/H+ antiporter NhaA n=1 Tax=unclassified Arthrobacter TaxID=235627 RepID=UPI001D14C9D6|nr:MULTISPECIES: Na+/H+ antiporter NhaA [unclassified Arthrobacter]MCC3277254.1 Na+/H+ antiporter NhaA [Arthrobacter sp. zg-Y20]MCC9179001.1 Na+/H+ antiporter NhaA [Arthrobacter sp. zg-Y750]MDK1317414.1 Na+/H+ antiporter NhaA [Arthrobacter sp. zg.Y20]MDK1328452.1 Na+/H+ antiporter NhaA [Arthrobacter sp. zg-Y1143]WIB07187.1 Na+/H+ antiporter NhaA [Arthrobacter sp. zg-Y20]
MASESPKPRSPRTVLSRGSYGEAQRIGEILRKETVGGILLLVATVAALIWANSPVADSYFAVRDFEIGYEPWHLKLSIGAWAADGLLAIFFFLVGLELKKEFVAGDLRDIRQAIVPIAAAVGGVVVPALIYVAVNVLAGSDGLRGWAIPTATDIAFALAVLAVISSHLPSALRIFLLTLAVVDDLIAITIIAFFYSDDVHLGYLLWMFLPLAAFTLLVQRLPRFFGTRTWPAWVILLPLAVVTWALMHASGVHATVAGVLLGFAVPVLRRGPDRRKLPANPELPGLSEIFEHRFRPISTGFAVPLFAFFSAGVALGGFDGLGRALTDPVAIGIIVALVLGKPLGILATTWGITAGTKAKLDPDLRWVDLLGIGVLGGIGFTVSLLVNDLSFAVGSSHNDDAKVGILAASLLAALLASILLTARNRRYRAIEEQERLDADNDGVPDVYEGRED